MKNKRLIIILSTVGFLLLIPIIAMQLTNEVNWTLFDFLIASILLLITGMSIDYITRKLERPKHRIALSVITFAMLLLIWAEFAVGILGTPLAGH